MRNVRSPASLASPTLPAPDAVPSGETEERLNPSLKDVERTHSGETRFDDAFPRISDLIQTVTPEVHRIDSVESKTFMSDFQLKVANPVARMAFSQDVVGPNSVKKRHPHASQRFHQQRHDLHHHHHSHNYLEVDNPLQRKDIFYSGSLRHIAEYQSSENMAEYRQKVTMAEGAWQDEEEEESGSGTGEGGSDEAGVDGRRMRRRRGVFKRVVCDPLRHVFDVSLLRSPTFVIYGFSCFLCMLGERVVVCVRCSLPLSVWLSLSLSVSLSLLVSLYVCFLYVPASLSFCLCLYLSVCLCLCMSVCLSFCLSVFLPPSLSLFASVFLSLSLSPFVCLSLLLSVCLSACLSVSLPPFFHSPPHPLSDERERQRQTDRQTDRDRARERHTETERVETEHL